MTDQTDGSSLVSAAAAPEIKQRRAFSIVWIVPVVALLIGAWLAYKAISEKGPTITITFESADGLEAGKTKVKYKDVEIGTVQTIELDKNLENVKLTVEMEKDAESYLKEETKFWVVRARVAAGQVTGLGTLFSGAYIGIIPASEGKSKRYFKGLEKPPIVTGEVPGRIYRLVASRLGSLNPGSPIYFRQIEVGKVVDYTLGSDGQSIDVQIFIQSPYSQYVRTNTRFWVASGLDLDLTANGLRIDTESVVSLLIGGLAFANFSHEKLGPEAEENAIFKLYDTYEEARDDRFKLKRDYMIEFKDSVRGLTEGAPVEFRGIQIGEVVDFGMQADFDKMIFTTPVRVRIEPERLISNFAGEEQIVSGEKLKDRIHRMVKKGFRAQLKTGSLLTGQLFVDLDFYPDAPPVELRFMDGLPIVPSVPSSSQEIMQGITRFIRKLDQVPLDEIGRDLQRSIAGIDRIVNGPDLRKSLDSLRRIFADLENTTQSLNADTVPQINATLKEMEKVVKDLDGWVSADAPLQGDLRQTLQELAAAGRAISDLAELLDRHPEALIQGKESEGQ
jgi:paraquat-inducible protein B